MSSRAFAHRRPITVVVAAVVLALVALGGTSYAVGLARNSVLSKHIKNGQVRTADLGTNAVTGAKVKDGSLRAGDFAPGELPDGGVETVTVVASSGTITPGSFGGAQAMCPAGMVAVGGGPSLQNVLTMVVTGSYPVIDGGDPISLSNGQHGPANAGRPTPATTRGSATRSRSPSSARDRTGSDRGGRRVWSWTGGSSGSRTSTA